MGFSKSAFKSANEGDSGFEAVPNGNFTFEVQDCDLAKADSGAEMFKLNLQVVDDDEYDGKWVFVSSNIVKKDGSINEIGLRQMNTWLSQLSDGKFDPDDFEEDNTGEIINTEEVLCKFIGSKFKGFHKSKVKDGYTNSTVTFKSLLENTYSTEGKTKVTNTNINDDELDVDETVEPTPKPQQNRPTPEPKPAPTEKDARVGMEVIFLNEANQEEQGTIQSFIEGPAGEGMVIVKPLAGEPLAVLQERIFALPEEEDFVEEELPLVVGSKVKSIFRGKQYEGTIHTIDESAGECKVKYFDSETQKMRLRPQKLIDCVVIG